MKKNWQKLKNKIKEFYKKFIKWSPPLIFVYGLLVVLVLYLFLFIFRLDNDFWFLINTGKYIVNNGIPHVEPFTIHSDFSFIVQQWLTDIIFYFTYSKFNVYGMFVFTLIISLISVLLIYKLCMLVSGNKINLSFFVTIFVGALLNKFFITTRPQIFDVLFILLELYLLELYIKKNNKLYLIGLPLISLLMINLHASIWLMLFVVLVPYFIDVIVKFKSFEHDKYSFVYLGIIALVMFGVGFINPYGIDAIKYLFNSYGVDEINNYIIEMMAVTIDSFQGIIVFIFVFVVLFSYYYSKGKKIKLRYLLLFLGTCYLGFSHYKGGLFLFVGSILSLSYNFSGISENSDKVKFFYNSRFMNGFMICLIVLFVGGYGYFVYDRDLKEENVNYLHNLVDYLDSIASKDIKLYTDYDNGGYLQYRGYKTYLDPRAEVFLKANNKKADVMVEFYKLQYGKINYKDFFDKYNFDYLVVSEYDILYNFIDSGYEIVYEDKVDDYNKSKYRIYKRESDN